MTPTHRHRRRSVLRSVRALLGSCAALAACTAHVTPAATTIPIASSPPAASAPAAATPVAAAPAAPAPPDDRTVINFEEDTGGALPDGPELDVVSAKSRAKFRSMIDPKYQRGPRDGGAPEGGSASAGTSAGDE